MRIMTNVSHNLILCWYRPIRQCMIIAVALMIGTLLVIRAIVAKKHTGIFQEMAEANKALANK